MQEMIDTVVQMQEGCIYRCKKDIYTDAGEAYIEVQVGALSGMSCEPGSMSTGQAAAYSPLV